MTSGYASTFSSSVLSQKVLAYICVALNIVIVTLAVFLAFLSILITLTVASSLYPTDALQVTILFGVVCLYAVLIIIVHCNGMNISMTFGRPLSSYKGHFIKMEVPAWELFTVLSMLIGVGYAFALPSSSSSLRSSLLGSLERGLNQYALDPAWKEVFDAMHQTRGCCGVGNYTDWRQSTWMSQQQANEAATTIAADTADTADTGNKMDDAAQAPAVPPSCCKPETRGRCQHDLRRQRGETECSREALAGMLDRIYTEGCWPMLAEALETSVAVVRVDINAVLILQAVVLLLTALLHRAAWKDLPPSCYQRLPTDADADDVGPRRGRARNRLD